MNDKLLIDRTLLEQALKCLETPVHEQPLGMRTQTASAFRAALAQEQEPDDEPTYCPTCGVEDGGTTCGMPDCGLRCGAEPAQEQATGSWHDGVLEGQLRERERWMAQEQPEPAQEPVAWMWEETAPRSSTGIGGIDRKLLFCRPADEPWKRNITPLYTAPPQRPPLTDKDMLDIIDDAMEGGSLLDLVRAIERKVRGE